MGPLSNNSTEIQNLHFQSPGVKTSGKICISLLIRRMGGVAWDFWNLRNHTVYVKEVPRKLKIIYLINKRVTCQIEKVSMGLLTRFQFLLHTLIHTLITRPIR